MIDEWNWTLQMALSTSEYCWNLVPLLTTYSCMFGGWISNFNLKEMLTQDWMVKPLGRGECLMVEYWIWIWMKCSCKIGWWTCWQRLNAWWLNIGFGLEWNVDARLFGGTCWQRLLVWWLNMHQIWIWLKCWHKNLLAEVGGVAAVREWVLQQHRQHLLLYNNNDCCWRREWWPQFKNDAIVVSKKQPLFCPPV